MRWRYWSSLVRATGAAPVVRAAVRRLGRPRGLQTTAPCSSSERASAAAALCGAPRLFPEAPRTTRAIYRLALPGAAANARARAERILVDGEAQVFGRAMRLDDLQLDPVSGRRFDPTAPSSEIDIVGESAAGIDPKWPWELARGAHLVELGVASRLHPDLSPRARATVVASIERFLEENPLGRGIHWTAPLEAALRALHWLAALELTFALHDAPPPFRARFGGALVEHGRFLAANIEDAGIVAGNHVLGELLGLLAIGCALGGAAEATRWRDQALARLPRCAAEQLCSDGTSFEGSTSYHRFVLELLVAADRVARAAERPLPLGGPLRAMFNFLAGTLDDAGREPGFGDGDDGRVLPFAPHPPRDHGYLLSVGAARLGDPRLKRPGLRFSEEAVWLTGAEGLRRFGALPSMEAPDVAGFPDGGVHVLRGPGGDQVTLRAGGHGQGGVGGHTHNDQLSTVVTLGGHELVIDPGTFCYGSDPLWRDRFRATAAHATVIIDGNEQAELHDGRLFALPEQLASGPVSLRDDGVIARASVERGAHRREVTLDRARRAVVIRDRVDGERPAGVVARFPLGELTASPVEDPRVAGWLAGLRAPWAPNGVSAASALLLTADGRPCAILAALEGAGAPSPIADLGWRAPRYGERRPQAVVKLGGKIPAPALLTTLFLLIPESEMNPC